MWNPIPAPEENAFIDKSSVNTIATSFYEDNAAFSKIVYEPSTLNRRKEEYGPGIQWHNSNRGIFTDWFTNNSDSLSCKQYKIGLDGTTLENLNNYPNGELFVTKITDEDKCVSYAFVNKLGQVVMERKKNAGANSDTYYVYDDFGNLRYVLPPAVSDISQTTLSNFAYIYKYDERNRCIEKKLPGCEPFYFIYDKADQLIFSQDGNQRSGDPNTWSFFLYDSVGRPIVSGICINPDIEGCKNTIVKCELGEADNSFAGYIPNIVLQNVALLSVNYYDNYDFISFQTSINPEKLNYIPYAQIDQPGNSKGLLTGTRLYQLDNSKKYTISATYYDQHDRIIQTHTSNRFGGFDDEYIEYSFIRKPMCKKLVHSFDGKTTLEEFFSYSYDKMLRLVGVEHSVNGDLKYYEYKYDKVGRLISKTISETPEQISYNYNVRDWLTQIVGTKFNQTLTYESSVNGVVPDKALYNGNISAMKWRAGDETTERGYRFAYDGLNRLTAAAYGEGASLTANLGRFNETVTAYDKAGNILSLQRQGKLDSGYGMMDNLAYTYTGNRLIRVSDAVTTPITYPGAFHFVDRANVANEYTYDANGNLTKDLNKNIASITYNSLNLPSVVAFADGNTVSYGYDAAGSKLSVAYTVGGSTVKTEYAGNKVYRNGTLSMILTEEGYITLSGTTPTYHYYLKDHQGNNRVVIDQAGTVEQVNHYYPFGGLFGEGLQTSNQPYRYNGKELDRMHGLDWFDYGARHYDAALGRWWTPDPLAEKYYPISPYAYCGNNPVRFIDPDGKDWYEYTDKDGNSQTMWRKSQDKTYKDGSGNIWNNVGENYLSINGDNATLFTQHKNNKGELYLSSSSYNLANEKSANTLTSTLGDILSKGSAVAGGLGGYAEGSNATFRLTNSKGALDFKFYGNGWKGNQWVTPNSISSLGKVVQRAGKVAGYAGIFISGIQFMQASTLEGRLEHGLDTFMGGMGFVPVVGTGISLYWSFGGKQLHYKWVDGVLMPQMEMGIIGLPATMPFK
ncbi:MULTISPECIES: RHS repeat-associated core domain-containing protein [unclassified Proteiniphilum]|uniref:RHS repeat-associated core domain-containing protein n=1 Tax=unclassified Proteiniphilum TaxID=2622718 RepID=UPI00257FA1B4|nr:MULTISPECIES: RHS repeat-associated core domain-containing protein [unclassified Proteiniphilum]